MSEKRCFGCMLIKRNSPLCEHCGHDERRPNAPHQLPPGTILNNQYLVGKVLGQGGFGITYMGWDQFLGIPVAIKEFYPSNIVIRDSTRSTSVFLSSEKMADHFVSNRDRFVREATSLAMLGRSPDAANIVRVQNLVQANSTAYIIMEYVDGTDMRGLMRQKGGVLTLEETLRLLLPLMKSLETVHNNHLVHRDISPDNIMVLPSGSTKLIDFGAAHEFRQDDMKSTEAILKHGFAPPEQYQRKGELGPWTDVYALCATIYYCTTGLLPPSATDRVMGSEDFEWDQIPGITPGMIRVLRNGTAIHKDDRIQTMAQLQSALDAGMNDRRGDALQKLKNLRKALADEEMEAYDEATPLRKSVTNAGTTALEEQKTQPLHMTREAPVYTAPVSEQEAVNVTTATRGTSVQKPENTQKKKSSGEYKKGFLAIAIVAVIFLGWLVLKPKPEPAPIALSVPTETIATEPAESAAPTETEVTEEPIAEVFPWEANVLMHTYDGVRKDYFSEFYGLPVFRSEIRNDQIKSVTFLSTLAQEGANSWDVSHAQDGTVKAWAEPNGDLYDLYIAAENGIDGRIACENLFSCFSNMETVNFGDAFHTDYAENMNGFFFGCRKLTELDITSFHTENVTDMSWMFGECSTLTELDVSRFDTGKATTFKGMFACCRNLPELDVTGFDTSAATNMNSMFAGCGNLAELDLSRFDTSSVTDMGNMFGTYTLQSLSKSGIGLVYYCSSLKSLNISSFDTARVTAMDSMFLGCSGLTSLDVSSFDTASVTSMYRMFSACSGLTTLDTSKFDTAKVTTMNSMFEDCSSLTSLDVSSFETSNVENMGNMFRDCSKLSSLDVSKFDTAKVTAMNSMFLGCANLTSLDVSNFKTAKVTLMTSMFNDCSSLTSLDVGNFKTSKVTSMACMFKGCAKLTSLDVSKFDTAKVTDMNSMFWDCSGLTTLDVSRFITSNVTDMHHMFSGCSSITALDVSKFDTSNVTDMSNMFSHCSGLTQLDVSKFNTTNVTRMQSMFWDCPNLTSLDVSGFDTSNVTTFNSLFASCAKLSTLDVSGFETTNVTNMRYMFYGCTNLTTLDVSGFDTSNVTTLEYMFYKTEKLDRITISNFKTGNVVLSDSSGGATNFMDRYDTVNGKNWINYFYQNQYQS